ncbi:hypothetical protein BT63DRAFT_143598 [Microthyrium microscopicum]|uniref:Tyrosine specific protein phosphatases domain-containing protein n=1 Tax=Microthyrium microscopicum TaxID=703497 RepID=A0A6A6UMJ0_9PEZI|nr:hypothetical protein BT63DRAFT_143598 [Microthyrium microscopicum]
MSFSRPGALPTASGSELPPPFITVPSLGNLRDVGGLQSSTPSPSATAQSIRSKILYRAADPSNVPLEGLSKLHNELRIRTIFDLRSAPEISNAGGVSDWEGRIAQFNSAHGGPSNAVTRYWTPVFRAEDYGPESVALRFRDYGHSDVTVGFVKAYEAILESGAPNYGIIIKHLARDGENSENEGTLVHCTAGKDRTGVLVAVILAICGVPDEVIAEEYQLTELGLSERRPALIARLVSTGAFGEGKEAAEAAERMTGARKEAMLATLRLIEQKYGGPEQYAIKECRLTDDILTSLRKRMLFTGPAGSTGGQAVL